MQESDIQITDHGMDHRPGTRTIIKENKLSNERCGDRKEKGNILIVLR